MRRTIRLKEIKDIRKEEIKLSLFTDDLIVYVENPKESIMTKNLSILKEKGILILLDDFGKGYTGFGDLTEFDISIVKIDKSIAQNATTKAGFLILKNIIQTAHDLGFKTLCEGIETDEHKKTAVDAGCDMLQGYYFYRPMSVTQLETLFEKQK